MPEKRAVEHTSTAKERFCTYGNIDPVFVTNTTLAVSMSRDLEVGEYISEITLDGRRVRQLTFAR